MFAAFVATSRYPPKRCPLEQFFKAKNQHCCLNCPPKPCPMRSPILIIQACDNIVTEQENQQTLPLFHSTPVIMLASDWPFDTSQRSWLINLATVFLRTVLVLIRAIFIFKKFIFALFWIARLLFDFDNLGWVLVFNHHAFNHHSAQQTKINSRLDNELCGNC